MDSLGTSLVAGIGSGGSLGLSLSSVESRLTLGSSVRTELNVSKLQNRLVTGKKRLTVLSGM